MVSCGRRLYAFFADLWNVCDGGHLFLHGRLPLHASTDLRVFLLVPATDWQSLRQELETVSTHRRSEEDRMASEM